MSIRFSKAEMNKFLMYTFLTIPFFKPELFNYIKFLDYTFNIWRIVSLAIAAYLCIRNQRINTVIVLLSFLQIYLISITLYCGGNLYEVLVNAMCVIGLTLVYGLMTLDIGSFLRSQLFCYEIAIYANFVSILVSPAGQIYQSDIFAYHNYLLCYYNNMGKYFYPAIMFALMNAYISKRRMRAYLLITTICISSILMWSGGVLLGVFAILSFVLFLYKFHRIVNYFTIWMQQFAFLCIYFIFNGVKWLDNFVNEVLRKGASFNMRKKLWEWTIRRIVEKPILGHGFWNGAARASLSGERWQVHAHNLVLDTLYVGGLVYLFLFIAIIWVAGRNIDSSNKIDAFIISAFLGWSLQSNVDPFVTCTLMSLFVFASNSKVIRSFCDLI